MENPSGNSLKGGSPDSMTPEEEKLLRERLIRVAMGDRGLSKAEAQEWADKIYSGLIAEATFKLET